MGKYNLLGKSAFVFIFVLVIGIIWFSVAALIRPEDTKQQYFFQPFPDISPKDLPDAHTNLGTCYQSLRDCSKNTSCTEAPNNCPGNFTCKTVTSDDNIIFNNRKVPEGKWCIADQDEMPASCNTITGKLVWTSNPGQKQHWSCECLYPRLYGKDLSEGGTASGDCVVKKVCETVKDGKYTKTENKLKGTDYAPANVKGKFWDPFGIDPLIATHYNPYQTDSKGNPYFTCSCNEDSKNTKIFLDKDPYACHNDVCSTFLGADVNKTSCDPTTGECVCSNKGEEGVFIVPDGPEEGLLFYSDAVCGQGSWDESKKCCTCTGSLPTKCRNKELGINMDILVDCEGQNPVGKTCSQPCAKVNCNGGTCKILSQYGGCSTDSPPNGKYYNCECPSLPSPNTDGWCLNPKTDCADTCLPGGKVFATSSCTLGICGPPTPSGANMKTDGSSCCSGEYTTKKDTVLGFGTKSWICSGKNGCPT